MAAPITAADVRAYLSQHGFVETAKSFEKESESPGQAASHGHGHGRQRDGATGEGTDSTGSLNVTAISLSSTDHTQKLNTILASYNPCANDPHGSTTMPLYQTATFQQPGATEFGAYDYTRSGNPTRDALQNLVAKLEGEGCRGFAFSTGMSALNAVVRLAVSGDEVIVNDDSYGGTYRLMSRVASNHGIRVKYVNLTGEQGPELLRAAMTAATRLVMIESPTNPMQRICDVRKLAEVCHNASSHPIGTLLSIDNTMMSPVLSQPIAQGADLVVHSATKFMSGHSDTMAGVVITRPGIDGTSGKALSDVVYFYQNAEGTGLAPFDCWLVLRGLKTMALRVIHQQDNAARLAHWLRSLSLVRSVIYAGFEDHPDYAIHSSQASGGGSLVCFTTGNIDLSKHVVTTTKLFKITVSFGGVSSLISLPGQMSHASIPAEVRSVREFPEDLVRISVGIEDTADLIADLWAAFTSYSA